MRPGELFGLEWPDVDFAGGFVQVRRSLEEISGYLRLKEVKTNVPIDEMKFGRPALMKGR